MKLLWSLLGALALTHSAQADVQSTYGTGAEPARREVYDNVPTAARSAVLEKNFVDLSGAMPPPGDQGKQGSCVGWALAYAVRSFVESENHQGGWSLESAAGLFSPSFLYNQIKHQAEGFCTGETGIPISDGLYFLTNRGAVTLDRFPYTPDCNILPSRELAAAGRAYRIARFEVLGSQGHVAVTDILQQLQSGRPVIVGIGVDDNFQQYRGGILAAYAGPTYGRHAIVVVGFDRTTRSVKLLNSWGRGWGESGYVRIAFEAFERMLIEAYVVTDVAVAMPQKSPADKAPSPLRTVLRDDSADPVLRARYEKLFGLTWSRDHAGVKAALDSGLSGDVRVGTLTAIQARIESSEQGIEGICQS